MNTIFVTKWLSGAGVLLAFLAAQALPAAPEETQYSDAVDALTRGPIHEAFAEPVQLNPEPGVTVSQSPPAAIDEQPPDVRPEDENAVWIPGYWGWDADRDNFVWISGVWRVPPPGYSWVPGYWTQVADGYQWVAGFWTPVQTEEIQYLPPPPQTLETGPSSPAPSTDVIWSPGVWSWQESRYVWRPGYWIDARPDWVWVPAHYVWTPRGAVFVDGHWDYPLDNRGVLFAPVYFERPIYTQPAFVYTPSIVIDAGILTSHLFTWPRYGHYYFGDYYGPVYERRGIRPWFEYHRYRHGYDPIFAYRHWRYGRNNPRWYEELRSDYRRRVVNADLRPPRTYREQVRRYDRFERLPAPERRSLLFARPLQDVVRTRDFGTRWQPMKPDLRRQIIRQDNDFRQFRDQRSRWEVQARAPRIGVSPGQRKPETVRIPNLVVRPRSVQPGIRTPGTLTPRPQAPRAPVPSPGSPQRFTTPRAAPGSPQRFTTPRAAPMPVQPSPRPELREYRRSPFTPGIRQPSVTPRPQRPSTVAPSDRSRFQAPRIDRTPATPVPRSYARPSPSPQPRSFFQAPSSPQRTPTPSMRFRSPSVSPSPAPRRPSTIQPGGLGRRMEMGRSGSVGRPSAPRMTTPGRFGGFGGKDARGGGARRPR